MIVQFRKMNGQDYPVVEADAVHTVGEEQVILWTGISPNSEILVVTVVDTAKFALGPVNELTGLPVYFIKA